MPRKSFRELCDICVKQKCRNAPAISDSGLQSRVEFPVIYFHYLIKTELKWNKWNYVRLQNRKAYKNKRSTSKYQMILV